MQSFSADQLPVRVHEAQVDMAHDVARAAQACLQQALSQRGAARAILATGNSQIQFLEALVGLGGVDWKKVTLFHMDEYVGLNADHPASFRRYLRERVETRLSPRQFHYLQGDAPELLAECDRYVALLGAEPVDLCCLGIGENGHLAFNDPPVADFADPRAIKIVRLDEGCRRQQVGEGHFPNLDAVPPYALTLTIPTLCAAGRMLCVVPERRKAAAVRAALRGPVETACPASILRRQAHATLFLDAESASLL